MTPQTLDITETLIAKLQSLPPEQQQTLLDFAEFLAQKYAQPQPVQQRIPDLNRGEIWMSEDFNDPLPDEFWTGEQ
jgi:mRNA-degrading endonuclease RelE of RelBE toxin-antitoxin system